MSKINFNNASLLNYTHTPRFFGENIFNYSIEKKMQVQGYLLDLQNFAGVSGIISGIDEIKNLAKNSGEFFLNGYGLGTGYIENIEVLGSQDDPNWVRYANYTADIIILSTGSIHDMTGSYYDIDTSIFNVENLYLLTDFNENFSINLKENGIYEYQRECNFEFENGIARNTAVSIAKMLASGIMQNQIPLEIIDQYGSNFLSGRKLYKENYDIINNIFSFSEQFTKSKSGDFADALFSYDIETEEDGMINVRESIEIKSLLSPLFEQAIYKLSGLRDGSYARCQNIYNNYYNSGILNSNSISRGFDVNKFNGEIKFETKFSNSEFIESGYEWEFTSQVEDDPEKRSLSLTLQINGHGAKNSQTKWNNTISGYNVKRSLFNNATIRNNAYAGLYSISALRKCRPPSMSYFTSKTSMQGSYANGTIQATVDFYDINRTFTSTNSTTSPAPIVNVYRSAGITTQAFQKTIGRESFSNLSYDPNLPLSMPPEPPGGSLVESSASIYDFSKNTKETRFTKLIN